MASRTTRIGTTDFYLSDDGTYVGEAMTNLRWNPDSPRGYMMLTLPTAEAGGIPASQRIA